MALVPIIIPFYKEHEKLEHCLAAIAAQTHGECETFVRDNSDDNILFTAAVNEGLAKYCYRPDIPYVVVLNQDAYMDPDCVQRLVAFMDAHPECGIACPFQYADTTTGRKLTWAGSLAAFPSGAHRKAEFGADREPFETPWANGAAMMIRTQVVRECGQFDRNMRFICSDSDFSFTARARGWKVFALPQALVHHALGGSGKGANEEIQLVKARDVVYFADKWLSGGLYRRMAHEGAGLGPAAVRKLLRTYRHHIGLLERRLGVEPSEAAQRDPRLPSWLMEASLPPQARRPGSFS